MAEESQGHVLIVDDDPQVRSLFETFLGSKYQVETAASGEEALKTISERTDVVLLDRRMPGLSGSEVLEAITDVGYDCRIAIVTAVQPDLDVVEMGFDDYVIKPVTSYELHNVVDSLLNWEAYDAVLKRYFDTARKVSLLEEEHSHDSLADKPEYQQLLATLQKLQSDASDTVEALDTSDGESVTAQVNIQPDGDNEVTGEE